METVYKSKYFSAENIDRVLYKSDSIITKGDLPKDAPEGRHASVIVEESNTSEVIQDVYITDLKLSSINGLSTGVLDGSPINGVKILEEPQNSVDLMLASTDMSVALGIIYESSKMTILDALTGEELYILGSTESEQWSINEDALTYLNTTIRQKSLVLVGMPNTEMYEDNRDNAYLSTYFNSWLQLETLTLQLGNLSQHTEKIFLNGKWEYLANNNYRVINIKDISKIDQLDVPVGSICNVVDDGGVISLKDYNAGVTNEETGENKGDEKLRIFDISREYLGTKLTDLSGNITLQIMFGTAIQVLTGGGITMAIHLSAGVVLAIVIQYGVDGNENIMYNQGTIYEEVWNAFTQSVIGMPICMMQCSGNSVGDEVLISSIPSSQVTSLGLQLLETFSPLFIVNVYRNIVTRMVKHPEGWREDILVEGLEEVNELALIAKDKSEVAQTTANEAKSTANSAQTTANSAQTTANDAKTIANDAKSIAQTFNPGGATDDAEINKYIRQMYVDANNSALFGTFLKKIEIISLDYIADDDNEASGLTINYKTNDSYTANRIIKKDIIKKYGFIVPTFQFNWSAANGIQFTLFVDIPDITTSFSYTPETPALVDMRRCGMPLGNEVAYIANKGYMTPEEVDAKIEAALNSTT